MSESPIKQRWLGTQRSEMKPIVAGQCDKCGGNVFHRSGKPGEYDHECGPFIITERELVAACERTDESEPKAIRQLLELVYEHHAHGVLDEAHLICPICSKEPWRGLLEKIWSAKRK